MHNEHHQGHPNTDRVQRIQTKVEARTPQQTHQAEQRLKLNIMLVNRLLNEQSHRTDAVRLLRQILRERAISQQIKNWDENNLSG